jgi:hypothetical protein
MQNSNTSHEDMLGMVNVYYRPDCVPLEAPRTPRSPVRACRSCAPACLWSPPAHRVSAMALALMRAL